MADINLMEEIRNLNINNIASYVQTLKVDEESVLHGVYVGEIAEDLSGEVCEDINMSRGEDMSPSLQKVVFYKTYIEKLQADWGMELRERIRRRTYFEKDPIPPAIVELLKLTKISIHSDEEEDEFEEASAGSFFKPKANMEDKSYSGIASRAERDESTVVRERVDPSDGSKMVYDSHKMKGGVPIKQMREDDFAKEAYSNQKVNPGQSARQAEYLNTKHNEPKKTHRPDDRPDKTFDPDEFPPL